MDEHEWLARQFEENRGHLRTVAHRMLGSPTEAEDAVQEAWLRLSRSDARQIENLAGWLTTVVARVCLDALRARKTHEQAAADHALAAPSGEDIDPRDTEKDLLLADSIGSALLVVLDALEPAERVAFVLHDMFDMPFEEIGPIVGRTSAAARQLASRARRRVRGSPPPRGVELGRPPHDEELVRHRAIIDAFLAAARGGDLQALLAVLSPGAILRADEAAVRTAAASRWGGVAELPGEVRGAEAVAATFNGRSLGARPALIDGAAGAAWIHGNRPRALWEFTIDGGKIQEIVLSMNRERLAQVSVVAG